MKSKKKKKKTLQLLDAKPEALTMETRTLGTTKRTATVEGMEK